VGSFLLELFQEDVEIFFFYLIDLFRKVELV